MRWRSDVPRARAPVPVAVVVDVGMNADERSSVGTNVVLIGTELAALGRDALELLLSRRVRIANLHDVAFVANSNSVELLNNLIANVAVLEAGIKHKVVSERAVSAESGENRPSESNAAAVAHAVTQDLARQDGVFHEDDAKFLRDVSVEAVARGQWRY